MRINYKAFPLANPHPAFPKKSIEWVPAVPIAIVYGHTRSKRFEAIVDSGSMHTLFHADIGKQLGMNIEKGTKGSLGGVIGGPKCDVYYHRIKLVIGTDYIEIIAGFSDRLSQAGLLGQVGLFDNFIVTFDNTPHPPCFELQRIQRN